MHLKLLDEERPPPRRCPRCTAIASIWTSWCKQSVRTPFRRAGLRTGGVPLCCTRRLLNDMLALQNVWEQLCWPQMLCIRAVRSGADQIDGIRSSSSNTARRALASCRPRPKATNGPNSIPVSLYVTCIYVEWEEPCHGERHASPVPLHAA